MPRERNRYRERRNSSCSSESSYDRKKSKKHKRRSRSTDRSESSHKRKRSISRSRHKRRSYSRSLSRDRYESKSRRRSRSHSRSKRSRHSASRDKSRSPSSSHGRSKQRRSKKSNKKSRTSSSRSSSFDIEPLARSRAKADDTKTKVEKAIKAAEAAGLTMTKIPTYEFKDIEIKEDMPTIHDRNVLDELNNDSFVQRTFTSSRNKKQSQNIVIDLNSQTVKVPESEVKEQKDDSILDFDEILSEEELKELWIRKLYDYRKKMLRGEM